jgi:predicted flap endonuclease-1-like 5' DNA nuclease
MWHKFGFIFAFLPLGLSLTGLSMPAAAEGGGTPWWVWLLIIVVFLAFFALVIWWWLGRDKGKEEELAAPVKREGAIHTPAVKIEPIPTAPPAPSAPPEPDDLKLIEGIGPKIAAVLQAAGIVTFAQLAETEVDRLRQILNDANPNLLRLADPATWPEQAGLAARGDWEAFETLLDTLKGGRRV